METYDRICDQKRREKRMETYDRICDQKRKDKRNVKPMIGSVTKTEGEEKCRKI